MTKVRAEGSIWKIIGIDLSEPEFAERTGAVKATRTTPSIWRLYFPPKATPSSRLLADMTGAVRAECIVDADHEAMVTPTISGENS